MNQDNRNSNWVSLSEYSNEYGISISTLRRRIKNEQIEYKKLNGKYFLPNKLMHPRAPTPVPNEGSFDDSITREKENNDLPEEASKPQMTKVLLGELKKAYLNSLQDKEKNIIQLKQQVADLKTLVLYLEKENKRLEAKPEISR